MSPPSNSSASASLIPLTLLWHGLWCGAVGGLAFGLWMDASSGSGAKFELVDKIPALRALADQLGERWTFILCCVVSFAAGGLVVAWRLRHALARLRRQP